MEDRLDPAAVNDSNDQTYAKLPGDDAPRVMNVIDLLDPSVPRADADTRAARMAECRACDRFRLGTLCAECNCVMKFKTWLEPAVCPLGKW